MTSPAKTTFEQPDWSLHALPGDGAVVRTDTPKLRIWACYPDGSHPESVEITYDGEQPVTAEFIGGIVQSLGRPAAPPIEITHTDMTVSAVPADAVARAARTADWSTR